MMGRLSDRLFIGIGGHVVAVDPSTGEEVWRTKLKTSAVTTVTVAGGVLYGAAGGELFRLDPATGDILWRNRLKGLGMGVVAFVGASDVVAAEVSEQRRRAAAAAASA
jgi:outer membrane protein assembly factor BamB